MKKDLEKKLDTLEFREREVVKLRYGLNGGYRYTDLEIMHIFRISFVDLQCILRDVERKLGESLPPSPFPYEGN